MKKNLVSSISTDVPIQKITLSLSSSTTVIFFHFIVFFAFHLLKVSNGMGKQKPNFFGVLRLTSLYGIWSFSVVTHCSRFWYLVLYPVSSVTKMKKLVILYKSVALTFHKSSLLDSLCYPTSPKESVYLMILYGAK